MKNVLIVVDKSGSALDILSQPIVDNNPQLNIRVCPVHPKRPSYQQITAFEHFARKADVIHFQYWKSAEMLREKYDFIKKKKTVLSHHNPYDLNQKDWNDYDTVTVNNSYLKSVLKYAYKIPLCTDLETFKFKKEYNDSKTVNMVAGRIEASKGILEVAVACKELGYKFVLVGRISDGAYYGDIKKVGVDFKEDISVEELKEVYYESAIHVCNSKDNFESGTLPILEAMATGCPVLTRRVGHVPDLENGDNMLVREGEKDDIEDLKKSLKELMEDRKRREEMRLDAYKTVIQRDIRMSSRVHSRLYQQTVHAGEMVSVITPTFNRPENVVQIVKSLSKQTYKNFELVIADDGSSEYNCRSLVREMNEIVDYPIKYTNTGDTNEYHLAKARNLGVIEAIGDILVFIDDRFDPDKDALRKFVENVTNKTWVFGYKGYDKDSFVENFSAIRRQELINAGMFNERINLYGGMSQELRSRFRTQGFEFRYVKDIKCKQISGSGSRINRLDDIKEAKHILNKLSL